MRAFLILPLLALLSGCATATEPTRDVPREPREATRAAGVVDRSCDTDADCAVKNVGSCCGYHPACVNEDSETFPEQVKADCEAKGLMSVCGFREIASCACVANVCEPAGDGASDVK